MQSLASNSLKLPGSDEKSAAEEDPFPLDFLAAARVREAMATGELRKAKGRGEWRREK